MSFTTLSYSQLSNKIEFIDNYINAKNCADGSLFDANANVSSKNIATLEAELNKDINIQINRELIKRQIEAKFGKQLADQYIEDIKSHLIYVHDESSLKPYCASVTMYPLLLEGLISLGGESKPPQHLGSFCGTFLNFIFAASSQLAGAIATVEFLMYFDYFAKKDYGRDYIQTHAYQVEQYLQQIVYTINQPAAARGYQAVFWNISVYDQPYFDSLFGNFMFPDGTRPEWETVKRLQQFFLNWINCERSKSVLTFPVLTAACLVDENGIPKDLEFEELLSDQLANGNTFFIYQSDNPDTLSSCCRLRNEVSDNSFSYSLGAGGVSTGSINVITLNINRMYQTKVNLTDIIDRIQKYQVCHRIHIEEMKNSGMLTIYNSGFISLNKQYLTIGINGMVEAAEYFSIKPDNNPQYKKFVADNLKIIYDMNRVAAKQYGYMFNSEFVPAENLGAKNSQWDKKDGLYNCRDCYNSYFYVVEDNNINFVDKFILHGKEIIQYLDGGSALHLNLEEALTKDGYKNLIRLAGKTGCNYWCSNVKITICNECTHIDKRTLSSCPKCGSNDIDYGTRIIGYLKRVSSWSSPRQKEHGLRYYHRS